MLPYTEINPDAAFSAAFVSVGMHWASYIVAVGALLGITTGACSLACSVHITWDACGCWLRGETACGCQHSQWHQQRYER